MSFEFWVTIAALVFSLIAVFVSLRFGQSKSFSGIKGTTRDSMVEDMKTELAKAKFDVSTLQEQLNQKSEIISVLTQELIELKEKVRKLSNAHDLIRVSLDEAVERAVHAENQVIAYQDTVRTQSSELASMEEIMRDSENHRLENISLRARVRELIEKGN